MYIDAGAAIHLSHYNYSYNNMHAGTVAGVDLGKGGGAVALPFIVST